MDKAVKGSFKRIWLSAIAGLILFLVSMFITFMISVMLMMEQYQVDKMYADEDRKEFTLAIKELRFTLKEISDNVVILDTKNTLLDYRLNEAEKCCNSQ